MTQKKTKPTTDKNQTAAKKAVKRVDQKRPQKKQTKSRGYSRYRKIAKLWPSTKIRNMLQKWNHKIGLPMQIRKLYLKFLQLKKQKKLEPIEILRRKPELFAEMVNFLLDNFCSSKYKKVRADRNFGVKSKIICPKWQILVNYSLWRAFPQHV